MGNNISINPTAARKELAVGHFVTFIDYQSATVTNRHRFQNFHIGEIVEYTPEGGTTERYLFLPFGFSGVTISTDGSGTDADLIFPSNDLARSWAADAVEGRWTAEVKTMLVDPDDRTSFGTAPLSTFWGQISAGGFDETKLQLTLNSVVDAVGATFPQRRLTPSLVGNLPLTSNVSLQ